MLATKGIPSNPTHLRKCRAGCQKVESLSHVIQRCYVTPNPRIKHHNRTCFLLEKSAVKHGWQCTREESFRLKSGELLIPDLILKKNEIIISDVAIHWEGPSSLSENYNRKQLKYQREELINKIKNIYSASSAEVLQFIMSARGAYAAENARLVSRLGIPNIDIKKIVEDVIIGSISCHSFFMTR